MLYLSGFPSASDNTSGISLYPEIYNQKFKETTANADIQGTFNLLGQQHEANIGYNWSKYSAQSVYSYGSSLGVITTDLQAGLLKNRLGETLPMQTQKKNHEVRLRCDSYSFR